MINALESHKRTHEYRMKCTQAACMRITCDVHRPCARDAHMGSNIRRDSPSFLGMFFTTRN